MDENLLMLMTLFYLGGSMIMIFVMTFFYLQDKQDYLPDWVMFWSLLFASYVLLIIFGAYQWVGFMVMYSAALIFASFMYLKSTYKYIKMPMRATWLYVTILVYLGLMSGYLIGIDEIMVAVLIYTFAALFYIISGILFFYTSLYRQRFFGLIAIFFGLVVALSPLLMSMEWDSLIVFFIINLSGVSFTMGMVFIHLHRRSHADMFFKTKLYQMSIVDHLTGLFNRLYINGEASHLKPQDHPVGLLMCDVNNLKETNDHKGHQAGDKLLVKTAAVLQENLPNKSIISRYGGDEFLCLIPNTNSSEITKYIDILTQAFDTAKNNDTPLDISFGFSIKTTDIPFQTAFKHAEEAMYKMKSAYHKQKA